MSNFVVTCSACGYAASFNKFFDCLPEEEISCGIYMWVRCPKCQYEEEV